MDHAMDTALVNAILLGQFGKAKQLVWHGADVSAKNELDQTALQYAVTDMSDIYKTKITPSYIFQHEVYCIHTVNFGAVSAKDEDVLFEANALQEYKTDDNAARLSLVQELLSAGADVNNRDHTGCSPIQCAIYTGDLELVEALIDAGANLDNGNYYGVTALHAAVLCRDAAMVRLLLSRKADLVCNCDSKGNTALHWAGLLNRNSSHAAVIEELLKYPAHMNIKNTQGLSAFHFIIRFADLSIVKRFMELGADITEETISFVYRVLRLAVYNRDKDVFQLLLERAETAGIPIDQKCDEYSYSVLHHASLYCKPEDVRSLVARGAEINAKNYEGMTPLFLCVRDSVISILRDNFAENGRQTIGVLLESGSDVNERSTQDDGSWTTLLQLAIDEWKATDAVKMIIEYVALVEARKITKPVFDKYNLTVIKRNAEMRIHLKNCRAELKSMKNCKIGDSLITYFAVLTEPIQVIARYMRNEQLLKEFQNSNYDVVYPIYSWRLRANCDLAIDRQRKFNQASTILSTTLQFYDPSDMIYEFIFKYLSQADIEFLIKSSQRNDDNAKSQ
ncbi:hypothetical protein TSAR_003980 [Trichomalopsis sarcophagae]|uniref:Uncharacterized protein n=1 Tax=Trichomalopsis sarcophagae TaxID=543379 RepID=A0A232EI46_9HYME|nr:hypothetical protein TSAR_003980 [Trichomalopsis sarcophagae]